MTTDDLGITVSASVRLQGVSTEVKALFGANEEEHLAIVEGALLVGLTTIASATELTATDAARAKLTHAADRVVDAMDQLDRRHDDRTKALERTITSLIEQARQSMFDGRKEDQRLREELQRHAGELTKAAKTLDTNRADLEKKTLEALAELSVAQSKAKEAMLEGAESTLKRLVDETDPASAPAVVKGVVDKATSEMRETTTKHVGQLETRLRELLGDASPFADRIAKLAREGAEREIKRVEEALGRLRDDVIRERTREEHDPNVKGGSYEEDVLELLTPAAAVYGLTPEATGTLVGETTDSKKGDHILVDEGLMPRAAVEARVRKRVGLRDLLAELQAMAANRGVKVVAYFAKSTECLPAGLGEFSRGQMPLTCKRLPDDVQAIIAVIDPKDPTVAERLALVMWIIDRFAESARAGGNDADAAERVSEALPCVESLVTHLGMFRSVKGGLTKAAGQINRARAGVESLEALLSEDVAKIDSALRGA